MKVGIVSSVSIDHATPAAFYAHVPKRGQYYDIDVALAKSGFDYFGGGGLKDPANKRDNSKNFVGNALELAKQNGYTIVTQKTAFMALTPTAGKIIAYNEWLQDSGALPYAMDNRNQDITLAEFTAKGIELLDNKNGFFMMVEGGKIDWACHANDGTASIYDTLAFDAAVKKAYEFYQAHPDETLIVISGDHECGGLTLGFAGTKYATNFEVLGSQKVSFQKFSAEILEEFKKQKTSQTFAHMKPLITQYFGLKFDADPAQPMALESHEVIKIMQAFERTMAGDVEKSKDPDTYLLYGGYDPLTVTLTHILNQKAGMAWTSYKHTGVPVATSAVGVQAERFNGSYDNTDVALKIMSILGWGDQPQYVSQDHEGMQVATAQ
jgi:alkaline phosphatase